MKLSFFLLVAAPLFFSCTDKIYQHRIKAFLNANSAEAKGKYLSDDYHSYFAEKKGEGKNKTAALNSL